MNFFDEFNITGMRFHFVKFGWKVGIKQFNNFTASRNTDLNYCKEGTLKSNKKSDHGLK